MSPLLPQELELSMSSLEPCSYSDRERELLDELTVICNVNNIDVIINPLTYAIQSPAAIDIEHDEEGNLVGIGLYDGVHSYYFTKVTPELKRQLECQ